VKIAYIGFLFVGFGGKGKKEKTGSVSERELKLLGSKIQHGTRVGFRGKGRMVKNCKLIKIWEKRRKQL